MAYRYDWVVRTIVGSSIVHFPDSLHFFFFFNMGPCTYNVTDTCSAFPLHAPYILHLLCLYINLSMESKLCISFIGEDPLWFVWNMLLANLLQSSLDYLFFHVFNHVFNDLHSKDWYVCYINRDEPKNIKLLFFVIANHAFIKSITPAINEGALCIS